MIIELDDLLVIAVLLRVCVGFEDYVWLLVGFFQGVFVVGQLKFGVVGPRFLLLVDIGYILGMLVELAHAESVGLAKGKDLDHGQNFPVQVHANHIMSEQIPLDRSGLRFFVSVLKHVGIQGREHEKLVLGFLDW